VLPTRGPSARPAHLVGTLQHRVLSNMRIGAPILSFFRATAVLPQIPHSNSCKRVPNRPLRPRRGRFGTLLQLLECGNFGRTAVVHVAGVLAKKRGGRGETSHGSGGRLRTVSPTWLKASLCNVSLHVFWQHGRTLGVCEVQTCEGRVFFSFRWLETGGLCFRRAGNEDACCISPRRVRS